MQRIISIHFSVFSQKQIHTKISTRKKKKSHSSQTYCHYPPKYLLITKLENNMVTNTFSLYICTYTHTCAHAQIDTHKQLQFPNIHIHNPIHICSHIHIHTYINKFMRKCKMYLKTFFSLF